MQIGVPRQRNAELELPVADRLDGELPRLAIERVDLEIDLGGLRRQHPDQGEDAEAGVRHHQVRPAVSVEIDDLCLEETDAFALQDLGGLLREAVLAAEEHVAGAPRRRHSLEHLLADDQTDDSVAIQVGNERGGRGAPLAVVGRSPDGKIAAEIRLRVEDESRALPIDGDALGVIELAAALIDERIRRRILIEDDVLPVRRELR